MSPAATRLALVYGRIGSGAWVWCLIDEDGTLASHSGHALTTAEQARDALEPMSDRTTLSWRVFEDDSGHWRWEVHGSDGLIGASIDDYADVFAAIEAFTKVRYGSIAAVIRLVPIKPSTNHE